MTIPASVYTLRVSEYHVPFSNDTLQMWSSIETCQQCSAHQDKNIQGLSPCLICCHQFLSCNFWITLTHLNLAPDNSSLYEDLLFPLFFLYFIGYFLYGKFLSHPPSRCFYEGVPLTPHTCLPTLAIPTLGIEPLQDQGSLLPLLPDNAKYEAGAMGPSLVGGLGSGSPGGSGWLYCSSYGVTNCFSSFRP